MSETDAFFTQSIVGAPFSIVLGRRLSAEATRACGIEVPLDGTAVRLGRVWQEQVLLDTPACDFRPRTLSTGARRWLERHALIVAGAGLGALLGSLGWTAFLAFTHA